MTAIEQTSGISVGTLEALVGEHVDLVYSAALRQVRDPHLADDVTQAVFMVMVRKAERLPREELLGPWLVKVTRYVALTALRADRRRRRHEEAVPGTGETAGSASADAQMMALLDEALMALA